MISSNELERLSQLDFSNIDLATLVEASAIKIDQSLPHEEKLARFIDQIGNPYFFLSNGIPVRVRFAENGKPLSQSLAEYFIRLKNK